MLLSTSQSLFTAVADGAPRKNTPEPAENGIYECVEQTRQQKTTE